MQPLSNTPSIRNGTVLKARTVRTLNGTKINWRNVSYFTLKKVTLKEKDVYEIDIFWKYKASIKSEAIVLSGEIDLYTYFKGFGIVQLGDKFINLHKIITIDEKEKHGPIEKTVVRIIFTDGFQLVETVEVSKWVWWKNNYA